MFRCSYLVFLVALLAFNPVVVSAEDSHLTSSAIGPIPIDEAWALKWREDLAFAKAEMPGTHIRIDHSTPRSELDTAIDDLAGHIPTLAHHQAVVELARIVAMIGDGHTRLTLPIDPASGFVGGHRPTEEAVLPGAPFHHYPVRFFLYADGLAIERIGIEYADLLGAVVVRIGMMSAEEAMAAVEPTIHRDNKMQVWQNLPTHLVIPEILHAQGVIDSLGPLFLELETPAGERRQLAIEPLPIGQEVAWADRPEDTFPLFRRNLDRNYRFELLDSERTVYFRYLTVQNEEAGESLPDFARRMFAYIGEHNVERLIIDIRGNGGGNNWLNAPLERGVIRATSLWRPGGLVVLADRYTFSAAMNFVSFLAGTTPAIFVGEATGGRPNHYGDARQLQLPNTGLTVRLSTVYHQDVGAEDDRDQIEPHVPIPLTAADISAGRDPALEEILGWSRPGDPAGSWQGLATVRQFSTDVTVRLERGEGGWSGRFGASGWLEETAITSVERVAGEVRFDVPLESTVLRVRTRATEGRLIGMFDYQGQWYPFVAQPSTPNPQKE